ncbi:hypothetical protein [Chitinophaga sp. CF418]|uniref:hypothetical protein n=1 Tax=Chitinophaga sp. CF418 TaxID=1855287 RepID=UPI00091767B1|nr:hypothetical protein [Chitinophaga sp. CF418]SHN12474.1 hypothetical protein SAMN05216311_105309 [Chitinophaga sp. CF418]
MKTKGLKFDNKFFEQKVTMTVSERLNALDLTKLAPKKQELANRLLEKVKDSLPRR